MYEKAGIRSSVAYWLDVKGLRFEELGVGFIDTAGGAQKAPKALR